MMMAVAAAAAAATTVTNTMAATASGAGASGNCDDDDTCSCGHRYRLEERAPEKEDGSRESSSSSSSLLFAIDSSFVHLPSSSIAPRSKSGLPAVLETKPCAEGPGSHSALLSESSRAFRTENGGGSFLGRYRYLQAIESVTNSAITNFAKERTGSIAPAGMVPLCPACVEWMERALAADAERLECEVLRFEEAVQEEEARSEGWMRAVEALGASSFAALEEEDNKQEEDRKPPPDTTTRVRRGAILLERQEAAFRDEIEILRRAADEQEQEIGRLLRLRREQAEVLREMHRAGSTLEEERNDLELQARAFDIDHGQLSQALVDAHDQASRLSSTQIRLLSNLYEMTVDNDRGLRYPLINRLRLAYRPKGDVHWDEIQAAWSLAAQMLLSVATVFNFQSSHWKIVPLSHCAKLIYTESPESAVAPSSTPAASSSARALQPPPKKPRSMVFNLGHPLTDGCRALLAWNYLLHEVVRHAALELHRAAESGVLSLSSSSTSTSNSLPSAVPPFEITSHQVGDVVLSRLSAKDDAGWSKAIHCMASNLLWLSECASSYICHATALQAAAGGFRYANQS